jgi:hypothetical protein
VVLVFQPVVQLPAELAHEVDPKRLGRRHADDDVPPGEPRERLAREIGIAHPLEQHARLGPGHHQHAHGAREVLELHRAIPRHVLLQPIMVEPLPGAGRDQIEAFRTLALDRELGMHAAARVKGVTEVQPARRLRDPVGDQMVEEGFGTRP